MGELSSIMRIRVVLMFLAACLLAPAQTRTMSVDKLVIFLRSSIKLKMDDKAVADYVRKIKLTDRLDDVTIETLHGEGVGPKAVQAMKDLRTTSHVRPAPPPPPPPPPPQPSNRPRT